MSAALRIYRALAKAFPHEFKIAYGADVMLLGEDVIEEIAATRGTLGLVPLLMDIAMRLPLEYLSEIQRDARYAVRALIASPGFALVGILSIGIGIGLTTMVYDSRWQLISRPLPGAANAEQLVMPDKPVSYVTIEQFRAQTGLFAGVAALETPVRFSVLLPGDASAKAQRVFGQLVSPDYFRVLGVRAQAGRVMSAELDKPGDAAAVVISDRFWRARLDASPNAIGQMLRLNGQPAVIVGITPRDFSGALPLTAAEMFVPVTVPSALAPELSNDVLHQQDAKEFLAIMRLQPGVGLESAESALDAMVQRLAERSGTAAVRAARGRRITLLSAGMMAPIPRALRPAVVGFFAVLMGLIMTIACVNIANLLLARGANRRRELATRLAVGASRSRLIRQMVTEGVLLSLLGAVAGIVIAFGLALAKTKVTPLTPGLDYAASGLDWHAAIFPFVLAIMCGITFSLLPALRVTRSDLIPGLKEGSALQLPGHRRFGMRNLLMTAQLAGSLTLLLITGFLVLGFAHESRVQTTFDPRTMYLLSVDPLRDGYSAEATRNFFQKLPKRLEAVPSVRAVALAAQPPFTPEDEDANVQATVDDVRDTSRIQAPVVEETVGAGYFAALSQPLVAGREFTQRDHDLPADGDQRLPIVVNRSAAAAFFGRDDAIGRRLRDDSRSYEVVGIVRDLNHDMGAARSRIYIPLTRRDFARPSAGGMTIMVRADAAQDALRGIRREIAMIDAKVAPFDEQTLSEYLERSHASERFAVDTYGAMGVFGLILAAVGLAGVTAYAVAQRRKELGIRIALGASKGQLLGLVLREGVLLVGVGTFFGLLAALALAKVLSTLTSEFVSSLEIGASNLQLLIGAPLLLAVVALVACYIPARRAASIDPLTSLRQ
ncbi:MAG TPA: ADOP family duplicated permease [Gemmatimonadaceae bacterium]|jgi:predicted permease